MFYFPFLVSVCYLVSTAGGSDESSDSKEFSVLPEVIILPHVPHTVAVGDARIPPTFVKRVEDTLNLTCKVDSQNYHKFKLSWHGPISSQNSKNRVAYNNQTDSLNLVVQHLQENDSGDYRCLAEHNSLALQNTVTVKVKSRKAICGDKFFTCPQNGHCIPQRFVCDGHPDCKSSEDESETFCGILPCQGKLTCGNRCIPVSWCCQQYIDVNCTVKNRPPCCQQIKPYIEHDGYSTDQQRFNDIHFLQTTIYTVIGCSMAFMLIVTILIIAICRVHMKRTLLTPSTGSNRPNNVHHHHHHLQSEIYDLDLYVNRSAGLNCSVTYNINNGVQFVGHPVDPPPYCEVVASPPREGPPPPYASREDVGGRQESEGLLLNKPLLHNREGEEVAYFWPRNAQCSSSSEDSLSAENHTAHPNESSSSDSPSHSQTSLDLTQPNR